MRVHPEAPDRTIRIARRGAERLGLSGPHTPASQRCNRDDRLPLWNAKRFNALQLDTQRFGVVVVDLEKVACAWRDLANSRCAIIKRLFAAPHIDKLCVLWCFWASVGRRRRCGKQNHVMRRIPVETPACNVLETLWPFAPNTLHTACVHRHFQFESCCTAHSKQERKPEELHLVVDVLALCP